MVRFYFKIFLFAWVLSTPLISIEMLLVSGFPEGIIAGLTGGAFFACYFSIALGTSHLFYLKIMRRHAGNVYSVCQSQKIMIHGSYDAVFDRCLEAIKQINKGQILTEDRVLGRIHGKTGWTWRSFGEKIEFKLIKTNEEDIETIYTSAPIIGWTLADYGKNYDNINIISEYLRGEV